MTLYKCKICKKSGREYITDRKSMRKHLQEVHGLKGAKSGEKELFIKRKSEINKNMIEMVEV